jgi:lipoprotein-releasing system permease protein
VGVLLGVATLIVVLGVMTGFHKELKRRILGLSPHIMVTRFYDLPFEPTDSILREINELQEVREVVPYVYLKSMVRAGGYMDGAIIKGVPPSSSLVKSLEKMITMGDASLKRRSILIGINLASNLRVVPGDTVFLFSQGEVTPLGTGIKPIPFQVEGIFDAGLYDYNATLIIARLDDVSELLGFKKEVSGLDVFIKDPYRADKVAKKLEERLSYPLKAVSWIQLNRSLFSALKLEKFAMFVILTLIVIVASFSIVATLMLLVTNKTKEIGVLRAMGFSASGILRVFILVGLSVGLFGTALGGILGLLIGEFIEKFRVGLPQDVYFINRLPVVISPRDVLLVIFAALFIVFFATLYPARKAAKLNPVDAIRYE